MKQQYTALFPLSGILMVERPVVWHANKKPLAIFNALSETKTFFIKISATIQLILLTNFNKKGSGNDFSKKCECFLAR